MFIISLLFYICMVFIVTHSLQILAYSAINTSTLNIFEYSFKLEMHGKA